nr:hypothetical protein [Tanacetum cinerariifolium]
MANLSEDIQCVGSDTRRPILDRTDFASWKQRIRLYCRGKENGVNILKSTNEGPFQMGTFRETITEGEVVALHLGPERARVYFDLSPEDKERNQATVQDDRVVVQNVQGRQNRGGQDNVVDEDVDEPSVHDHDNYQDAICEYHEAHKMHDNVQPNCVVDSNAEYTGDNNMIPYDHYVKENTKPVVQNNVSYVPNDAYMMIINKEQTVQCIYAKAQIKVVDASLTAELATCKEQVELYERRAKFELTEGEQKIEEQLRIVITDRNIKEENFKEELHSVKMQLNSIINHNKSMVEKVTSLKKDFKQKENKYLEEFLDIKALKEKADDKLIKQDRSLQTVHMLCKPKPYYDEQINIAIGYKNPLCLTHAKQVQPALCNGHEIIKTHHIPAIVHNLEYTLEIVEITKKKMN